MKLTAKGYDGLYELRYSGRGGKADKAVPASIRAKIKELDPPHRPGTSGRVYDRFGNRCYASVIGCFYKRVDDPDAPKSPGHKALLAAAAELIADFSDTNPEELQHSAFRALRRLVKQQLA